MQFNAVLKLLAVIGEECSKINDELIIGYESIHWRAIKDMRNRIVHDYRGVDAFIIYSILREVLHELKNALIQIFGIIKSEFFAKDLKEILSSDHYRHLSYLL